MKERLIDWLRFSFLIIVFTFSVYGLIKYSQLMWEYWVWVWKLAVVLIENWGVIWMILQR